MFRIIKCDACGNSIGMFYFESVWEENDEKSFSLIHPLCMDCTFIQLADKNTSDSLLLTLDNHG